MVYNATTLVLPWMFLFTQIRCQFRRSHENTGTQAIDILSWCKFKATRSGPPVPLQAGRSFYGTALPLIKIKATRWSCWLLPLGNLFVPLGWSGMMPSRKVSHRERRHCHELSNSQTHTKTHRVPGLCWDAEYMRRWTSRPNLVPMKCWGTVAAWCCRGGEERKKEGPHPPPLVILRPGQSSQCGAREIWMKSKWVRAIPRPSRLHHNWGPRG